MLVQVRVFQPSASDRGLAVKSCTFKKAVGPRRVLVIIAGKFILVFLIARDWDRLLLLLLILLSARSRRRLARRIRVRSFLTWAWLSWNRCLLSLSILKSLNIGYGHNVRVCRLDRLVGRRTVCLYLILRTDVVEPFELAPFGFDLILNKFRPHPGILRELQNRKIELACYKL